MNPPVKLGIIGTNFVSSWLCEAARTLDTVSLAAVYSRKEETGRVFADREGVAAVYTDLHAFLTSGIEAVYIASPTYCHYEMAKKALTAGLHTLVEKPIVMREAELCELLSLAKEKGLVLMEAMRPEFDGSYEAVRDAVKTLGRIRHARFEFCQYSSRYDAFRQGEILNAFKREISGGALYDIGIYPLFWATALFERPNTVEASSTFLQNGFEGGGSILLGYDGFQVSVVYSKICSTVTPSVILGEEGALTLDKLTQPETITVTRRGDEPKEIEHTRYRNNLVGELSIFLSLCENGGENPQTEELKIRFETLERVRAAAGIEI